MSIIEAQRARKRVNTRRYYALHIENIRAREREQYRANPFLFRAKARQWRINNPEKVQERYKQETRKRAENRRIAHAEVFTTAQVAKEYGVCSATVRRWVTSGYLTVSRRYGPHLLISPFGIAEKIEIAKQKSKENSFVAVQRGLRQYHERTSPKDAFVTLPLSRQRKWQMRNPDKHRRLINAREHIVGIHTARQWLDRVIYFGSLCWMCRKPLVIGVNLTKDHTIPVSKGGSDWASNLRPACLPCNIRKSAKAKIYLLTNTV